MIVAIHQPEYMPWLGLLDKAKRADLFVFLDHVQFNRASLQHRARIIGQAGPEWLTIPFVHRFPQRIDEVAVADGLWPERHAEAIRVAYGRAPSFDDVAPWLDAFFAIKSERVADAAIESMRLLFNAFGVATATVRSSGLDVPGAKSALVLGICQRLGATRYLCGPTAAKHYLDHDAFAAAGIAVDVQEFAFPDYDGAPAVDGWRHGLSALDAWMYLGDRAKGLLS